MKRPLLRFFCLTLVLLMLLPLALSCKKDTEDKGTETTASLSGYQNPVEVVDFGGRDYKFMGTLWHSYTPLDYTDISPEGITGDLVSDAAFERVTFMRETYNCNVTLEDCPTKELLTKLEANAMAGDGASDFILLRGEYYVSAINGGYLAETSSFDIDPADPWWDSEAIDTLTINNKNYGVIGDVTVNHLMSAWMVCFNKTMVSEYKLNSPYEMVKNGTWNYENVITIARGIANDNDGVEGMSKTDIWGINYTRDTVMGILLANGVQVVSKNGDGIPELKIHEHQSKVQDILTKLYDETFSVDTMNPLCECKDADTEIFDDKKCLFLFTATHNAQALRNSEVDYGILPYPKAAGTDEYISTTAGDFLTILSMPTTNSDYNNSSIFLNAFAAYGNAKIRPQFYENVLLRRTGNDLESYDMLKYIFENLKYDIGTIYNITESAIRDTSRTQDTNFASLVGQKRQIWKKNLDNLLVNFGVN